MANLKELIVNGVSHFIGKVFINDSHITTINGVEVTENPKFTDTVTTVAYDSTNKKITKTINGTTSDVVTAATLKTAMGLDNVEANQNAFSNVKVGTTTISADTKTDTLELAAGSNITLTPDATNDKVTINATDTKYSAGDGIGLNGTVFSNTGVTGVKGNAENTYKTGNVNLTADQVGAIPKNTIGNTQNLSRPLHLNGLNDNTLDSKINTLRANRLAFLPANQIIIEKTTDGGTTWVDAGVADSTKIGLFSETRVYVSIPLLNGVRSLECGLRITITAMKYNVPSGTAETSKYNYWNSNYVISTERYNQLKEMYFWVSAVNDTISIKVERATGAKPNNWSVIFENTSWGATGWSGNDYVRFNQNTFGGGVTQTSNYWNYRITFMTRGAGGGTTLATSSTASSQSIIEIRGYGDTWWAAGNNYAANDCLYSHDYLKNATFPANVSASGFNGKLIGDVTGNVTGNVTGDVTGRTSSMLIQNIASNANLNTITTDGWYMASTDAIASSLSNCPSTKSFLMEVYHINSASGSNEVIYQKISTSGNIHYERVKSGGAWSEWKSSCHIDLNGVVYI